MASQRDRARASSTFKVPSGASQYRRTAQTARARLTDTFEGYTTTAVEGSDRRRASTADRRQVGTAIDPRAR